MDGHFAELRDAEILRERIDMLGTLEPYIGNFYSKRWIQKNVLRMSDEEIQFMTKEIEDEGGGEDDMMMSRKPIGDTQINEIKVVKKMSKEIIDAIASGDNLGAESQFKNAIQKKVGDALEKRREEVANTMVTQHIPEVEDEEEVQSDICLKRTSIRKPRSIKNYRLQCVKR